MAGEVRIQTFVQLIKFSAYRQFSVPNPPLLLAAKRCASAKITLAINKNTIINLTPQKPSKFRIFG
jgi:hypothetical protein